MLVSGIEQRESVTDVYTAILFKILFPYRRLQRASLMAQLVNNPPAAGDLSSIPGSGRSAGEGYPLQYSQASLWFSW